MYDALHNALHSLQAARAAGFEGLIVALIGRLTGRTYFLAKSGSQAGKDATTAGFDETYIAIEGKRYRRGASPTARELLGGFAEAIAASGGSLDLWVVVSTGAVGGKETEALRGEADREAVAVEIIDWQEAGLPQLGVLCAAFPEQTLDELQARGISSDLTGVAADLQAVRNDPGFDGQLDDLRRRLSAAHLGLDHARAAANAWIEARLARKADAMAAFHQALCIGDADFQAYVQRPGPQASLDAWYATWPEHRGLAAVLGLEGHGKSWATMAWWKNLAVKPLTLLLTSNRVTESDALTLVASALRAQTDRRDVAFWERCLKRWLQREPSAAPLMAIILDGLNERPRQPWDAVFASLAASEWVGCAAIVTTCRTPFWSDRVAPFLPEHLPVTTIEVHPFDDEELARAWGDRRPALAELPGDLRDFIRTPRVFRLARHRIERLKESGDLTVARLLIEDWRDRHQQKLGLHHSETDLNDLVIALARDLRQGLTVFERHQLREYSGLAKYRPTQDLDRDLDEIIEGRLFEPVDPVSHRYRVRQEYVGLALGMLLARELRDAHRQSGMAGVEGRWRRCSTPSPIWTRSAPRCGGLVLWQLLGVADPDWLARRRQAVNAHRSRLTEAERRLADCLLVQAPTPHAPFMARLALLLISHGPRSAHVQGFIAWAFSRAIMGVPVEVEAVAWCLRLNRVDAAATEAALLAAVNQLLLREASEVGLQAAWHILWACGTPAAAAQLAALPAQPQEEFGALGRPIEVDPLDPEAPAPPDLTPMIDRVALLNPGEVWSGPWRTAEDYELDKLEPMLARFAPQVVGGFYRRLFQSAPERQGTALRQLAMPVPEHLLLLGPDEISALEAARRSLLPSLDGEARQVQGTEARILAGVLCRQTAEAQLDLLLERPESALDLEMFENVFTAVPTELAKERLVRVVAEGHAYKVRRLLWFLSHSHFTLNEVARDALISGFNHP
ncbi:MAG TPA: hypothetical protein VNP04_24425, partial [Alphaproteobacteria bacterium]|nr:hypothetical protein [Alphaproteobacteria bacterium]